MSFRTPVDSDFGRTCWRKPSGLKLDVCKRRTIIDVRRSYRKCYFRDWIPKVLFSAGRSKVDASLNDYYIHDKL